jgi:CRP/FNR family transcriptional regulator, cyclic AMP receptor protein
VRRELIESGDERHKTLVNGGLVSTATDRAFANRTLANVRFFRKVRATTIAEMERRCRWLDLEKGAVLIEAGEFSEKVYFLLRGELRYSLYTRFGKILSLPAALPGALVGFSALTTETPHPYSVDATKRSTLACMQARTFQDFMQRDPDILQALLGTMIERQHTLTAHIEELTTLDVRARIHNELARLCRDSTNSDGSAVIFPVPTHEDLANRIGTRREAVSRELSHLQHTGIVLRHEGALFVPDVARLMDAEITLKE